MLRKLYAYEYRSLFRSLLPIYIGLLGIALLGRMLYLFDGDSLAYSLLTSSTATVYVLGIIALFVVGAVIIVTRFYKNLLSGEGYLTFTLPFTPTQHIVCKLLCAVTVMLIDFIVVVLSLLILGAGSEIMKDVFDFLREMFGFVRDQVSMAQLICLIAEITVFFLLSFFQGVLMFYAAMAIGQQFKSKIGGAVLAYICMYVAIEVIRNAIGLVILIGFGDRIEDFFAKGVSSIQIVLLFPVIGSLLVSAACFIATRYFLTKRLNLE